MTAATGHANDDGVVVFNAVHDTTLSARCSVVVMFSVTSLVTAASPYFIKTQSASVCLPG